MKSKLFNKIVAVTSTAAMIGTLGLVPITANAEIIQTDVMALQTFDSYTAPANTEVIADPSDASNNVLKISNGATVSFNDMFSFDSEGYAVMDVYFPVGITGTTDKNYSGLYMAFAQSSGALGTAMKIYGASTSTTVPFGYTYGGGGGQYGSAGNLNIGTWYTVKCDFDKTAATVGYTVYDKADYAANGTGAAAVATKTGMGYRNGHVPNSLIINLSTNANEYFYIDNLRSYTEEDTEAANELKAISFKTTPGAVITPPTGDKEEKSYPIELQLTGTKGDLTAEECDSITWTHIGTEKDDGYIGWNLEENQSAGSISITNGVSTYFSVVTATVTKGENTFTATYRFMINASGEKEASQVFPAGGYPIDTNEYPDSLIGYTAMNGSVTDVDPILANWASVGSNGARTLSLQQDSETGDKYIEMSTGGGTSGSTVASATIGKPDSQVIFSFDAKLVSGSSFVFANSTSNNAAGKSNKIYRSGFEVSFDGSKINSGTTLGNGSATYTAGEYSIDGVSANTWYKFIISYDITIQQYYVKVYSADGSTLIGELPVQKGQDDAEPTIFSLGGGFPVGIKNFKVYKPTVASMEVMSATTTVKVPEVDTETATLDLAATMLTTEGLDATGLVTWSLADGEIAGVEIESTGAQTAQLKVGSTAPSGQVKVVASKDGISKEYTVNLTSSSNNVAFTKSTANITIPFDGEDAVVAEYKAETRTGEGNPIEGTDTITYRLLDSTKTKDAEVKGVTFDNGILTVEAGASPAIVYVYAENAEGLSNTVRVNIHGMTFGFDEETLEEGSTLVTASTVYTDSTGYGFASTSGLTDIENGVQGSEAYTMKVKVPDGNYKVNVTTSSTSMTSEAVSGSATGTTKSGSEFNVAVCDGVLDLTFSAATSISRLQISQIAKKTAGEKPAIYSIGDSTTKNQGHYSGYDPATATDHREYASWGNCVTSEMYEGTFASYANHGMAGRNSASYYNQARLEAVLLAVAPGDYVTINMGINSESGEPYEKLMEDYYVKGVLQRGGIPVILTHTPDGVGFSNSQSSYDEATGKFNVSRADQSRVKFLKSLAEKYNLDLIDVGQWGEDYFNSLTLDDLDKANTANSIVAGYTPPTTVYELVRTWYPDHNHYTAELGTVIAAHIIDELAIFATAEKYTVTFVNENGETVTTVEVRDGKTIASLPTVPAKEGYTGEWAIVNGEEVTPFTTSTAITADTTVTAVYTLTPQKTEYTVTFVGEDGETVGTATVEEGSTVNDADIPEVPAKDGAVGMWAIVNGEESTAFTSSTVITADTTVTAVYTALPPVEFTTEYNTTKTDSGVVVNATVTGTGSEDVIIYVAEYDTDGRLVGVKRATATVTETTAIAVDYSYAEGTTLKTFVLDKETKAPKTSAVNVEEN